MVFISRMGNTHVNVPQLRETCARAETELYVKPSLDLTLELFVCAEEQVVYLDEYLRPVVLEPLEYHPVLLFVLHDGGESPVLYFFVLEEVTLYLILEEPDVSLVSGTTF